MCSKILLSEEMQLKLQWKIAIHILIKSKLKIPFLALFMEGLERFVLPSVLLMKLVQTWNGEIILETSGPFVKNLIPYPTVIKCSDESNVREKVSFLTFISRAQSLTGSQGGSTLEQLLTKHLPPKKQGKVTVAAFWLPFSTCTVQDPSQGMSPPTVDFFQLFNEIKITPHKYAQRPVSQVIPDSVRVTDHTNHHRKGKSLTVNISRSQPGICPKTIKICFCF